MCVCATTEPSANLADERKRKKKTTTLSALKQNNCSTSLTPDQRPLFNFSYVSRQSHFLVIGRRRHSSFGSLRDSNYRVTRAGKGKAEEQTNRSKLSKHAAEQSRQRIPGESDTPGVCELLLLSRGTRPREKKNAPESKESGSKSILAATVFFSHSGSRPSCFWQSTLNRKEL